MMKRIICWLFGHKWTYHFPDTSFCKRCNYYPVKGSAEDEKVCQLLAKPKK